MQKSQDVVGVFLWYIEWWIKVHVLTGDNLGSRNTDAVGAVTSWLWWWRAGGFGSCSRGGLGAQLGGVVRRCPGRGGCSGRGRVSFLCALGRRLGRRLRRRVAGGMDGGLVVAAGCGMRLRGAQGWGLVRSHFHTLGCRRAGLFGRCWRLFLCTWNQTVQTWFYWQTDNMHFKGIAQNDPKMKIISLITHPRVVPNPSDLCSSSEHKLIYFYLLNQWCHVDYFNDVLTTFLGLDWVSCVAVYGGGGGGGGGGVRKLSDFIKNILICVLKMNEGLTGLKQHEGE